MMPYIGSKIDYNTLDTVRTPNVWKNKLNQTKHGKQMGDKWLRKNLFEMITDNQKRYDILENSQKTLTGISKNGDKLEIFELLQNTKKIIKLKL